MTKYSQGKLHSLNGDCTSYGKFKDSNTRFCLHWLSAITGVLLLAVTAISPAGAIGNSGPAGRKDSGNVSIYEKTIRYHLLRLLRLMENIEIDFYIELELHLHIRSKPEEQEKLGKKLSLLEKRLVKDGRLSAQLREELAVLRRLMKQV